MNKQGFWTIRFNMIRGGSKDIACLDYFAKRVYAIANWHLPAVSNDHLGLSKGGFPHIHQLKDLDYF
ncbi:TPA: hypothetical protein ACSPJ7_005539 [Bacillus cereus]